MLQHLTLLVILVMVGSLGVLLWATHPEQELKEVQQLRVKHAATLSFY